MSLICIMQLLRIRVVAAFAAPLCMATSSLPERALLVKEPWASLLVDGAKTWELRTENCTIRGRVGIAVRGKIIGEVNITDAMLVAQRDAGGTLLAIPGAEPYFPLLPANRPLHRVENFAGLRWKRFYAWIVSDAVRYSEAITYKHKQGCQKWMKLDNLTNDTDKADGSLERNSVKAVRKSSLK